VAHAQPPAAESRPRRAPKPKRRLVINEEREEKTEKIPLQSWKAIWPKAIIALGAIAVLALSAVVTVQLLQILKPAEISTTSSDIPISGDGLPDDKFGLNDTQGRDFFYNQETIFPISEPTRVPLDTSSPTSSTIPPQSALAGNAVSQPPGNVARQTIISELRKHETIPAGRTAPSAALHAPANIIVQMAPEGTSRFRPKEQQLYPTIANNVVLQRHYQEKHGRQFNN
jgi:hypothetical protein